MKDHHTTKLDRRRFLTSVGAATLVGAGTLRAGGPLAGAATAAPLSTTQCPKIAFLGTVVFTHSHAQHFLDRHTLGYTWNGGWQLPRIQVESVFIDQFPEGDLARGRIQRHGLRLYPTIEEALTLGGDKLAVDGVVIIGEHGEYPTNEKGQRRYPRYEWFKRVVKVFEASGRSVPVFNDKHLSTVWNECVEMVEDSRRLDFPFLAGSSLPVTRRMPSLDMPYDAPLKESVCVGYGGIDSYDFHALETAQCMSERRAGGERGVSRIHALRGENLFNRLWQDDCETTRRLIVSALTRSHNLPVETGFPTDAVSMEWFQRGAARHNRLPDRAPRWPANHHVADGDSRFQLRGHAEGRVDCIVSDVSADAYAWVHDRRLLQPVGPPYRNHDHQSQSTLSGRPNAVDFRNGDWRCRQPLCGGKVARNAASDGPVHRAARIDILERLIEQRSRGCSTISLGCRQA